MGKYNTPFRSANYKESHLSIRMVLYKGNNNDADGKYPVAVRLLQNQKQLNLNIGIKMTEDDFVKACEEQTRGSRKLTGIRAKLSQAFERVDAVVEQLNAHHTFSFDTFKAKYYNHSQQETATPYTLWREVAASKSPGTEQSYTNALNRFKLDMGSNVRFADFSQGLIREWSRRMTEDGLSKTTANIYLRALRVMLNEAVQRELTKQDTRGLFAQMTIGGRNSYNSRKHEYLDVDTWRRLWTFYESKGEGNAEFDTWRSDYQTNRLDALGMMLFMYLANGMNLRDVLTLRYDDFYYQHNQQQLRFFRQKVAGRTDAEVVFPILPEIRTILKRQGQKEHRGGLLFDYLDRQVSPYLTEKAREARIGEVTSLYNSVIGQRMKSVARAVGLTVAPTPTWCRHSFATNLIQQNVPRDYVSTSMAHALTDTTANYIDRYSYNQMLAYNRRLLNPDAANHDQLLTQLQSMTPEQRAKLMKEL